MTFNLEIMLRHDPRVHARTITSDRDAAAWTEADLDAILRQILREVEQVLNPAAPAARGVSLRGMSWIVNPYRDGVVIAFEIHSASAVAGPLAVAQERLEGLMANVMKGAAPAATIH
jgi:hypothetical protein